MICLSYLNQWEIHVWIPLKHIGCAGLKTNEDTGSRVITKVTNEHMKVSHKNNYKMLYSTLSCLQLLNVPSHDIYITAD